MMMMMKKRRQHVQIAPKAFYKFNKPLPTQNSQLPTELTKRNLFISCSFSLSYFSCVLKSRLTFILYRLPFYFEIRKHQKSKTLYVFHLQSSFFSIYISYESHLKVKFFNQKIKSLFLLVFPLFSSPKVKRQNTEYKVLNNQNSPHIHNTIQYTICTFKNHVRMMIFFMLQNS